MNCAPSFVSHSLKLSSGGTGKGNAHGIVDIFATDPADVLLEGGELGGAAEEHEDLVDGVRREVVHEPVPVEGEVLPCPLEFRAETIEPAEGRA